MGYGNYPSWFKELDMAWIFVHRRLRNALLLLFVSYFVSSSVHGSSQNSSTAFVVIDLLDSSYACVSAPSLDPNTCEKLTKGKQINSGAVIEVSSGKVKLLVLDQKDVVLLGIGRHNLSRVKASENTSISNQITNLLNRVERNTASNPTRTSDLFTCSTIPKVDHHIWLVNCRVKANPMQMTGAKVLSDILPSGSIYASLPKELTNSDYFNTHYFASKDQCSALNEDSLAHINETFLKGEPVVILAPRKYDWKTITIKPMAPSCKNNFDEDMEEAFKSVANPRHRETFTEYLYTKYGLTYDALTSLRKAN